MKRIVVLAFLCGSSLFAQSEGLVAVRAKTLIDGTGVEPISPAVVLVRGERIEAVGREVAIPAGSRTIDLGDATIVPGLIDLHTHLTGT